MQSAGPVMRFGIYLGHSNYGNIRGFQGTYLTPMISYRAENNYIPFSSTSSMGWLNPGADAHWCKPDEQLPSSVGGEPEIGRVLLTGLSVKCRSPPQIKKGWESKRSHAPFASAVPLI